MSESGATTHDNVRAYYGQTLQSSEDLKTSCCTSAEIPDEFKKILGMIDDEVMARFYGCGSPIPEAVSGLTALDLGCGTGRDCYLLSHLVGACGNVIGVDMTDEQLDVARAAIDSMTKKYGFDKPNVDFRKGKIEDLAGAGLEDNSVDLILSNCVLNLSPDKEKVFSEIFRVLKPGGELYFSDVYCDRRIPEALASDPVFHGECLGGALYFEDFRRLLARCGCEDYRIMTTSKIELDNDAISAQAGCLQFYSMTVRAFKIAELEDCEEDYGQIATYLGSAPGRPHVFTLDEDHVFEVGRPERVSGNTALILSETRFKKYFEVMGDRSRHFGDFDALGETVGALPDAATSESSSGCC